MTANLTSDDLKQRLLNGEKFTLVDVREQWEHEDFNIGGLLIPLHEIAQRYTEIPSDHPIVFYCRKGIRSVIAIQKLADKLPENIQVYNLSGGMEAWKKLNK